MCKYQARLVFVFILFAQNARAQTALRLQHISLQEGLSQSSVYYIFQDSHGYMWFATGDGLNRFDGREFIHYKSKFNDTSSSNLKNRTINSCLFEDKNGVLWMSGDAGLSYLDYRHSRSGVITSNSIPLYASPIALGNDILWATESNKGVYAIDVNNKAPRFISSADSYIPFTVQNAANTSRGLWIADNQGLYFFDKRTRHGRRIIPDDKIEGVILLKSGKLLCPAKGGYYFFDTAEGTGNYMNISVGSGVPQQWRSFAEDTAANAVYLAAVSGGSLCKIDLATQKYETVDLQCGNINCMSVDRSQNLWIGTEGNGVFKLDIKPPKFSGFSPSAEISGKQPGFMVKSIYRDHDRTWMGTYDHGLVIYDHSTQKTTNVILPQPVKGTFISTIFKDSSGGMVATVDNKVFWIDPHTLTVKRQMSLPSVSKYSLSPPVVYAMLELKKGYYLAGTNIGLFVVDGNTGKAFQPSAFEHNHAVSVWIYGLWKQGNDFYVARRSGFCRMAMLSDTTVRVLDDGFADAAVRHFYKSRSGILWIATEKGLVAYNESNKHYKVFDENSGIANSFIYSILPQNDSTLWVATNNGLSCASVHYRSADNVTASFINYSSKDGLQSNEFNTGAYFLSPDGTMVFGSISGINWFNPAQVKANPYKPIPSVAGILVDDQPYAGDTAHLMRKITLPYTSNTFSFALRALEFTHPEKNQFAYKLEGQDKDWVYTLNDKVRYSSLRPGSYTFLLKAANDDGVWNEAPLKIAVVILAPYWETWWFRSLMVIAIAAIGFAGIRLYIRQKVRARTRELEKQQALYMERLRISKDVHDDLGSGLSKISLMAELAQKKITEPAIGRDVQHISSVSKELIDNMRDLIWVLNPDNTTLEQLVTRLREYCADYLENLPFSVTLDFPAFVPEMRISREAQRNVFLTTKEAINNCVKHASACAINVSVTVADQNLHISVSDNGKGFDTSTLKNTGNGLRNMRQRIEHTGGTFSIVSSPGSTTIALSVPFAQLCAEKIPL